MEAFFEKVDRFFEKIKRMHVVKVFLLAWVFHFTWILVVGMTLFLCGAKFSQHVASDSEFTNSFLLVPFTALVEELVFRWGPMLVACLALKYVCRRGSLDKSQFFHVEKRVMLAVVVVSSIIFGWVHGNIFNVLLQGVSGIIFFVIYLRCLFIERDRGVKDHWQVVPLIESTLYHTMANAFLIFL